MFSSLRRQLRSAEQAAKGQAVELAESRRGARQLMLHLRQAQARAAKAKVGGCVGGVRQGLRSLPT